MLGLYLPPVFKRPDVISSTPDDHFTAGPDCRVKARAAGALVVLVAVQLSVLGIVSPAGVQVAGAYPAPDDHFAAGPDCRVIYSAAGALVVLVAVQLSVPGLYLPPVFRAFELSVPPQTIISLPVQTAV